jgi:hypothetical protein
MTGKGCLTDPGAIALRAYVQPQQYGAHKDDARTEQSKGHDIVAVLDTETTADPYLNLQFGSFCVWVAGKLQRLVIFYSLSMKRAQELVIRNYARNLVVDGIRAELMPVDRFIDDIFYPVVYDARGLLVGFNLPFDISRLVTQWGASRRHWRGGFSFALSEDRFKPGIRIRSLGSKRSFIEFTKPARQHQQHQQQHYRGRFLDLHTFGFALTNESLTLERACDLFQCPIRKMKASEHGKITKEYLNYNLFDTLATYSLYVKMMERFNAFHLDLPPERTYSPASIGKAYLLKMGIRSFLQQNPGFRLEILGDVMVCYYGGRSEVRIRKKSRKVRYLDFTSLYPSLFSIMRLWRFVIADRVEWTDCTNEVRKLLNETDLETLTDPAIWKGMTVIVQIQPDDDILPVRSHYGDKYAYNIGINHLTSSRPLWYVLPDVIASKLLTDRSPRILKAIKFTPHGKQKNLRAIRIIGGSTVSPDEDLFLRLRRLRKATQERRAEYPKGSGDYEALGVIQNLLKIIANSSSYGIFIEVNTEDRECKAQVYGLQPFRCPASKRETFGSFFNPIISATITAGARLLLAMAEAWLERHKAYYTFCDTDSIAVQPFYWKRLQEYFEPLNPIPEEPSFLKLEQENQDENGKLRDLWFYGISAKRYVLYVIDSNGEPVPVKWSSHGLGHLKHQRAVNWEETLWTNILRHAYGKLSREELLERYANEHAIVQLTITTPNLLRRVNAINEGKPRHQQIRPYNFMLAGSPTMTSGKDRPIIPLTQFTSDTDRAPYQPFIDAKTGRLYDANQVYWETLDKTVENYIDHPESKFENGESTGKMQRRHIHLKSVVHIGKEANELEETETLGLDEEAYVHYVTATDQARDLS